MYNVLKKLYVPVRQQLVLNLNFRKVEDCFQGALGYSFRP